MQRIFQAVAWLLAGIIVVLSLSPASVRPTTGAPHDLEHLLIFLATGMAFGFGYPDRFRLPTIIAQPTFAAAIEVGANLVGFRGSMAGLCPPLPTLRRRPYGRQRTARGRCGSVG